MKCYRVHFRQAEWFKFYILLSLKNLSITLFLISARTLREWGEKTLNRKKPLTGLGTHTSTGCACWDLCEDKSGRLVCVAWAEAWKDDESFRFWGGHFSQSILLLLSNRSSWTVCETDLTQTHGRKSLDLFFLRSASQTMGWGPVVGPAAGLNWAFLLRRAQWVRMVSPLPPPFFLSLSRLCQAHWQ